MFGLAEGKLTMDTINVLIFMNENINCNCTSVSFLHYGKNDDCRAFQSLPRAYFQAHGKEELCRAHFPRRTVIKNARQKNSLPCVFMLAHGKQIVCRAFSLWRTANIFFLVER
jgi:hypothetical protein